MPVSKAVGYDVSPIEHEDTFFLIVEKRQVILYGNVYDVKSISPYLAFWSDPNASYLPSGHEFPPTASRRQQDCMFTAHCASILKAFNKSTDPGTRWSKCHRGV